MLSVTKIFHRKKFLSLYWNLDKVSLYYWYCRIRCWNAHRILKQPRIMAYNKFLETCSIDSRCLASGAGPLSFGDWLRFISSVFEKVRGSSMTYEGNVLYYSDVRYAECNVINIYNVIIITVISITLQWHWVYFRWLITAPRTKLKETKCFERKDTYARMRRFSYSAILPKKKNTSTREFFSHTFESRYLNP